MVQTRRHLRSRSRTLVLYPVIATLTLAAIGAAYETLSAAKAPSNAMPGQLVDIGGRDLHLDCTGSGAPTVVLQPGMGEMSSSMAWIAPAVAQDARVCVYDRAGRGWSESASSPQDATHIATDLHALLQRAGVAGPYVLAGHSFGGLYSLTYAARYPDEVAGMVLIDSTPPSRTSPGASPQSAVTRSSDVLGRLSTGLSALARLGPTRLYAASESLTLPPQERAAVRASEATVDNLRTYLDEFIQGTASAEAAAALDDFADKPLVVLTADRGNRPGWAASQDRLATLSTNTAHRIVDGATHQSLIADEGDACATSRAILDVVSSVRSGRPLSP